MPSASVSVPPFSTPQPPRNWPGPPESGTSWCPVVSTGQRRSCPSSGWTARPTPKIGAVAVEPSLPFRPPQPPTIQSYHMKIGRSGRAHVAAADEQVLEVERAGDRPLGHDPRPELEDRVHDLLVGPGAEAGDGDGPGRVDDGALGAQVDGDDPVEAGVQRNVGEERLRPGDDAGERRAERRVEERADDRMRAGEVVVDLVALDRQLDLDRDQALARRTGRVDVVLGLPGAVRQLGDALAGQALDVVLHLVERRHDRVEAVLLDEAQDLALALPASPPPGRAGRPRRRSGPACWTRSCGRCRRGSGPWSQMRTGGMRRPSPKCSFALMSKEPGTLPPTSAQWPLESE